MPAAWLLSVVTPLPPSRMKDVQRTVGTAFQQTRSSALDGRANLMSAGLCERALLS